MRVSRVLFVSVACLLWLAGCETSTKLTDIVQGKSAASDNAAEPDPTGTVLSTKSSATGLLGSTADDDLALGKKHFKAGDYGLAERHFRKAVELHSRDAEAWLGLAAAYDRLRRFELADRAYDQAIAIAGPRPEILNNQGYSLILRGNYRRARERLLAAQAGDPANPYIRANLDLLARSEIKRKAPQ